MDGQTKRGAAAFFGQRVSPLGGLAIAEGDSGAGLSKEAHGGGADAARASGDESGAPGEGERLRRLGASEIYASRDDALISEVQRNHPQRIDGIIDLVSKTAGLTALTGLVRQGGCVLTTVFSADEKTLRARGLRGEHAVGG